MQKLLADENLKRQITIGLRRRLPGLDLVTVQDAGLVGMDDRAVLAWAASEGRIVVTHDVNTMPAFVYERLSRGESMPGLIVIPERMPIGRAIADLVVIAGGGAGVESLHVLYLPLRTPK